MITVLSRPPKAPTHGSSDLPAYEDFEDAPEDEMMAIIILFVRSPDIIVNRPNWFYMHMLSVKYGRNPHQSEF